MIEISKVETFNWEGAIRGMRNPYKNTDKSDSEFDICSYPEYIKIIESFIEKQFYDKKEDDSFKWNFICRNIIKRSNKDYVEYAILGEKDLKLAQKLSNAGTPHNKFMRQIGICMDINAPLYW